MTRPNIEEIETVEDFKKWYWLKEEMIQLCKKLELPYSGGKFELRDRIIFALDHPGEAFTLPKKNIKKSKFNWAKAHLALDTVITDNVSFGPNFRNFMKSQIGNNFSCHSDFMDWVKANAGQTLHDAVLAWFNLEARKEDPNFKREIAAHNMMSQYVRDFLTDNPDKVFKDAVAYWKLKKQQPTKDGFVKYSPDDLIL